MEPSASSPKKKKLILNNENNSKTKIKNGRKSTRTVICTDQPSERCVHTRTRIEKGDRFLKYEGYMCSEEPEGDDTYIFEFKWKGNTYWIDSTAEDGSFGRLVNDDQYKPNCKVKVDDSQGTPQLFFHALQDIERDEEILYNYGIGPYYWRQKRGKCNGVEDARALSQEKIEAAEDFSQFLLPGPVIPDESTQKSGTELEASSKADNQGNAVVPGSVVADEGGKTIENKTPETPLAKETGAQNVNETSNKNQDEVKALDVKSPSSNIQSNSEVDTDKIPTEPKQNAEALDHAPFSNEKEDSLDELINIDGLIDPSVDVKSKQEKIGTGEPGAAGTEGTDFEETKSEDPKDISANSDVLSGHDADENLQLNIDEDFNILEDGIDKEENDVGNKEIKKPDNDKNEIDYGDDDDDDDQWWLKDGDNNDDHLDDNKDDPRDSDVEYQDESIPKLDDIAEDVDDADSQNYNAQTYDSDKSLSTDNAKIDDDDMVEDSASDISEEVPYFPALRGDRLERSSSASMSIRRSWVNKRSRTDFEKEESGMTEPRRFKRRRFDKVEESQKSSMDVSDNDPDYKPDCDVSSDSDSRDTELAIHDSSEVKDKQAEEQVHHVSSSVPDTKPTIAVEQRRDSLGKGQRDWSRKHTCFICDKRVCDIPRHVTAKHPKEELVKEALSKPLGSKERRNIWRIITNKGTFKHNSKVKDIGGELHVFKRSSSSRKAEEYKACPHCYGYFLKTQLWRHGKKCHASVFLGREKNVIQSSISSISTVMQSAASSTKIAQQLFEIFLDKMRKKDEVFIIVKNDFLLSTYAKSLLEEGKEHSDTSWTVRLLAKLLISIREVSNCESYSWMELINTEHWNEIIHGVKTLSEFTFSESGIIVEKPNIALKCGQGIKGLIATAEGISLRQNDDVLLKKIEKMFKMYDGEWAKTSKHCNNSIRTKKEDQVELLPLTSDITKLKEKTVAEINRLISEISVEPTSGRYLMLSKLTLSRLITFNARRGGEPSKLRTKNWQNICEGSSISQEELDELPIEERKLAERLKLGYVKGKGARSKKVPIIFPEETVAAIDMLMQHRESFITNKSNPYIFARLYKNSLKSLRGSDCVREVCVMAELQHASLVTATQMRKYLATTLQLLDMKETELRWITDHMGHTVDVHKKWYRLSNRAVELTKVASILSATESGHLKKAHHVLFDNVSKDVGKSQIDGPHACTQNVQMTQQIDRISSGGSESSALQPYEKRVSDEGKKKQVHVAWRVDEKKALYSAFGQYLDGTRGLPGKGKICTAQTKFSILQNRSWLNIKYQLRNMLKKNK